MPEFPCIALNFGQARPLVRVVRLTERSHAALERLAVELHQLLLQAPTGFKCCVRAPRGAVAVLLEWRPAGHTAGVATCRLPTGASTVGMVLSALDPLEDEAAVKLGEQLLGESFPAGTREVLRLSRAPLLALVTKDRSEACDAAAPVAVVARALATAHFATLGI